MRTLKEIAKITRGLLKDGAESNIALVKSLKKDLAENVKHISCSNSKAVMRVMDLRLALCFLAG